MKPAEWSRNSNAQCQKVKKVLSRSLVMVCHAKMSAKIATTVWKVTMKLTANNNVEVNATNALAKPLWVHARTVTRKPAEWSRNSNAQCQKVKDQVKANKVKVNKVKVKMICHAKMSAVTAMNVWKVTMKLNA